MVRQLDLVMVEASPAVADQMSAPHLEKVVKIAPRVRHCCDSLFVEVEVAERRRRLKKKIMQVQVVTTKTHSL